MTSLTAVSGPSLLTNWLQDVEKCEKDINDCGSLIRNGNLSELRTKMNNVFKTLLVYGHDINGAKNTQRKIESVMRIQIVDSTDASFVLEQAKALVNDVCVILSTVSTSVAFLFAMDTGHSFASESKQDLMEELLEYSDASSDGGVISKSSEIRRYLEKVKAQSPGVSDMTSNPIFSAKAVIQRKIAESGVMKLSSGVPIVEPDDDARLELNGQTFSGSRAGEWDRPDEDEELVESDAVLGAGGPPITTYLAQLNRQIIEEDDPEQIMLVNSHRTAAASVPVAKNRTGRALHATLAVRVYGAMTYSDFNCAAGTGLLSTVNPRALAGVTAANFVKVNGVAQAGYKALLSGPNSDSYIFELYLEPGASVTLETPDLSATTAGGMFELTFVSQYDANANERTFLDLVGAGTEEAYSTLDHLFQQCRHGIFNEYNSYLAEKFGIDKLNLLATACGVANWRVLFSGLFWASPDSVSQSNKRRLAQLFVRALGALVRLINSDCQFLTWYSS
jgi:hypothetical protein